MWENVWRKSTVLALLHKNREINFSAHWCGVSYFDVRCVHAIPIVKFSADDCADVLPLQPHTHLPPTQKDYFTREVRRSCRHGLFTH